MCEHSHVQLFATPWTVARQAPLYGILPGKNTGVLQFPPPGDLPHPGIEPMSPVLQTDPLRTEALGKPLDGLHLPQLLEVI